MEDFPKVILHPKKERSLKLFHPWLFSGAVSQTKGNPAEGDIVEIFSSEGEYLATGHYHEGSIKARIFSFQKTNVEEDFWLKKLKDAFELRKRIGLIENDKTNMYRLVHGEGDGMPGVIIDIYGSAAVLQFHTLGMYKQRKSISASLKNIFGDKLSVIYDKSSETMSKQEKILVQNEFLEGNSEQNVLSENGILFNVNWAEGQKTGFFLDQRENRALLKRYSEGKKVLNAFSYSGGFSMYALKGGASVVHSVDTSKKAIELSNQNAKLNAHTENHFSFAVDVFDFLKKSEEVYDIIILDPPAFAKHLSSVDNAMIGYRNLNTEGFKRVAKGGLLFTFSCSQVIDRTLFRKLVFQAAAQSKRNVRILHQLSQGPDHPISIYHPEGEYLKGLVLVVD